MLRVLRFLAEALDPASYYSRESARLRRNICSADKPGHASVVSDPLDDSICVLQPRQFFRGFCLRAAVKHNLDPSHRPKIECREPVAAVETWGIPFDAFRNTCVGF